VQDLFLTYKPLLKLGGMAKAGPPKALDFSELGKPNDRTPRILKEHLIWSRAATFSF
jgi:hypothetical protein